ncbi:hypothetical protein ILYODFUR_037652 [Ilyodon furcidens]|uniref:Uncharacterized protein n=1 Tax=Ilyodon furcidens TaxID=33524 RepID=A0ABV0TEQ4_9TELE
MLSLFSLPRSYNWPDSVSTCDTFLERGIVQASAGNNLILSLVGVIHFGRTVEHAQLNRHRSSDITRDYKSAEKKKFYCHFPCVSRDDATEAHIWQQLNAHPLPMIHMALSFSV